MPNYNASTRQAIADIGVGLRVDRATAALPATTSDVLFTVSGGRVIVDLILGEVTTVIEATPTWKPIRQPARQPIFALSWILPITKQALFIPCPALRPLPCNPVVPAVL